MTRAFSIFLRRPRDPGHPVESIDRHRRRRIHRSVCGLYVDRTAGRVEAAVLRAIGSGRWIRFGESAGLRVAIPAGLHREGLRLSGADVSCDEQAAWKHDLAEFAATVIDGLQARHCSQDDPPLVIAVHDEGWSAPDFDGTPRFLDPLDGARLAERSALPVIDGMRHADVACGGRGGPLEPLATWMLLADRADSTATSTRVLVDLNAPASVTLLPASDGLDAEHPAIEWRPLPTWDRWTRGWNESEEDRDAAPDLSRWAAQGRRIERLEAAIRTEDASTWDWSRIERLGGDCGASRADLAHLLLEWVVEQVADMALRHRDAMPHVDQILLAGADRATGYLVPRLRERTTSIEVRPVEAWGWPDAPFRATVTAVLGFMHIDQQPASLPSLTGADAPRLHGRLHPGHPGSWRRLVVDMADYRPPR